jgi:uncharacterized protein
VIAFAEKDGFLIFSVLVVPRASHSEIAGEHNSSLRIRIAAPPVDGAANEELIRVLAKAFGVRKSDVEITSGHSSRRKEVRIDGESSLLSRKLIRLQ